MNAYVTHNCMWGGETRSYFHMNWKNVQKRKIHVYG